jgi:hypothetical protein
LLFGLSRIAYAEMASQLSEVLQTPIAFVDIPETVIRDNLIAFGSSVEFRSRPTG